MLPLGFFDLLRFGDYPISGRGSQQEQDSGQQERALSQPRVLACRNRQLQDELKDKSKLEIYLTRDSGGVNI